MLQDPVQFIVINSIKMLDVSNVLLLFVSINIVISTSFVKFRENPIQVI